MSDVLITYRQQNKHDKYFALPTKEKRSLDALTTNFIQELVTEKGSSIFDRSYGTNFISSIGEQVNIYKIEYIIKNNLEEIKNKYNVVDITVKNTNFNTNDGFLEIHIGVEYKDFAVERHFNFIYQGVFTEKTILEID